MWAIGLVFGALWSVPWHFHRNVGFRRLSKSNVRNGYNEVTRLDMHVKRPWSRLATPQQLQVEVRQRAVFQELGLIAVASAL